MSAFEQSPKRVGGGKPVAISRGPWAKSRRPVADALGFDCGFGDGSSGRDRAAAACDRKELGVQGLEPWTHGLKGRCSTN